ncbi:hypothetical protein FDP41_011235 [Naegleria fowleri]|uniref:Uncharacterized protein n=1 Tax=Naegleria fowleri TaxID=5763 RepID=A0A6A5CAA5_NAEFO|nr:uncharacterized protein FDP41_011235 [Naegleria fowleri]KAF0982305.1 hypothetical protein FDP41_011235 [Naegleria fowleri]CAG4709285.1 unnamed protein product [Naegleria fowleri]
MSSSTLKHSNDEHESWNERQSNHQEHGLPMDWRELLLESANGSLFIHEIVPYLDLNFLLNIMYFVSKDVARLIQQQNHHTFVVNLRKITNLKVLKKTKQHKKKSSTVQSKIKSMMHLANGFKFEMPLDMHKQIIDNVTTILERAVHNKKEVVVSIHIPSYYSINDAVKEILNGIAQACKRSTDVMDTLSLHLSGYVKAYVDVTPFLNLRVKHLKLLDCAMDNFYSIMEHNLVFDRLTISGPFTYTDVFDIYRLKALEKKSLIIRPTSPFTLSNGKYFEQYILPIIDCIEFSKLTIHLDKSLPMPLLQVKTKSIDLYQSSSISNTCLPKVISHNCESLNFSQVRTTFTTSSFTTLNVLPNLAFLKSLSLTSCHITLKCDKNEKRSFDMPNLTFLTLERCIFTFGEENNLSSADNPFFISLLQIPNAVTVYLIELGLKKVPNVNSLKLSTLCLKGNPINDDTFDINFVMQYPTLKKLDLQCTNFKYFKTIEPLFDKFEHLDLSIIPLTDILVSLNGHAKLFSLNFLYETERNKYFESSTSCFNGSDREIYESLKNILTMKKYKHLFSDELPSVEFIRNSKKSHLHSLDNTNVIFWNVLYSNNAARVNNPRMGTVIIDILTNATQFAIHLTPSLTKFNNGQEWIFIAFCYRNHTLQMVERLDSTLMETHIPTILSSWSYISSHRNAVQQLREKYKI